HSHAPGQPGHTHGPPQGQGMQQQQMVMRAPDPVMQAIIEESYVPVDIALGPPDNVTALCGPHQLEKCAECDLDFVNLNRLSRLLHLNPNLRCPPPPTVVSKNLSLAIANTKEEGNAFYKRNQHEKAIERYNLAINIAAQRPQWEAAQVMREELSTVLSNRAAAFLEAGDYIGSLVDAEAVIQLKRGWSKGHFRKARALVKMERFHEAKEAIELGLSFEPGS
ncbi:TPR-like protein, partial [Panus rudis PR-1116 ss-1]